MSRVLRAEPGVLRPVASDPTVSRTIDALAADAAAALTAIDTARAAARARVWALAGEHAPDHGIDARDPLVIDLDATLVTSHSDKEQARPDLQTRLRLPPAVRVRRPRRRRHRGTAGGAAAPGQRRVEHRRRPHHRDPPGAGAAARPPARDPARAARCWSAPTAPGAPTPTWTG